ncbi:MAG: hypothetical protein B6241_07435 [Spirochaetaceae bacterium 4572_59]|nr:MAG: hypothetical protein B6241_07435 [Spirochaetaceae bacterium 4572_59]
MSRISPEDYISSLIGELEQSYCSYSSFLFFFKQNHLKSLKNGGLDNFLHMEKGLMAGLYVREKTLSRWLKDFPVQKGRQVKAIVALERTRKQIVQENRLLMNEIASAMNSLKQEQKSLRIPRSKPNKKESAPSLIDIRL